MSGPSTAQARAAEETAAGPEPSAGAIRRRRGLPGGRAVVGALLVTAAAVGVFGAYLSASAEPSTRYAVAADAIGVGERLETLGEVRERLRFVPVDLPEPLGDAAFAEADVERLVGRATVAPLAPGELVSPSALPEASSAADAETVTLALPVADALGGQVRVGDRIDVLATYDTAEATWTAYVARSALVADLVRQEAATGAGQLLLTLAVEEPGTVQALGHAARTAQPFLARPGAQADAGAPDSYSPSPQDPGPAREDVDAERGPDDA